MPVPSSSDDGIPRAAIGSDHGPGLPVRVHRTTDPAVVLVEIGGELDRLTVPAMLSVLVTAVDGGARTIVLDLGGVRFCGVAGLRALAEARAHARRLDAEVYLRTPSSTMTRALVLGRRIRMDPRLPPWTGSAVDDGGRRGADGQAPGLASPSDR